MTARHSVARARRGAGVAAAVLACAALLSACGSSKSSTTSTTKVTNLDTARVAHSIERSILTQRHLESKVVCPAVVAQEQGKTFTCMATTRAIKPPHTVGKTPFVVTVTNNKGYVTYAGK